jgi:hypothetical protein
MWTVGRWHNGISSTAQVASVLLATAAVAGCGQTSSRPETTRGSGAPAAASTAPAAASTAPAGTGSRTTLADSAVSTTKDDPTRFAPQVLGSARRTGIHPQLLMAILFNESYKPHDPTFERAWHQLDPNSALGVANMHEKAFNDTKRGRNFAKRQWEELIDDPVLAIDAAAWYLHDLNKRLPRTWPTSYSRDDLLALGYNAGPSNMLAFARGGQLLPAAQTYLKKLHENWATAGSALQKH